MTFLRSIFTSVFPNATDNADVTTEASNFQALTAQGRLLQARQPARDSWVFNSTYSISKAASAIRMTVNPSVVNFTQAKRISTGKRTIGGTTYFHWSDKTGRNLDPLIMTISGETGTISGLGNVNKSTDRTGVIRLNGDTDPRALANAQNWAKLYTLTAEPQFDPQSLVQNVWSIAYKSLLFPNVTFFGFFNSVLQFSDDAKNPFSKSYSISFTVTETFPDILVVQNLTGELDLAIASANQKNAVGTPPAKGG